MTFWIYLFCAWAMLFNSIASDNTDVKSVSLICGVILFSGAGIIFEIGRIDRIGRIRR